MSNKLRIGVAAAAVLALGSASVSASAPGPESAEGGATIAVVTHGQASDPFWSVFKRGVDDAAAQMGATVNYSAPATFDMVEMASSSTPPSPSAPTVSLCRCPTTPRSRTRWLRPPRPGSRSSRSTPGRDIFQEIGAITHIGQDETIAGRAAGARLAEDGATNVICINQEVGNASLDARCTGAKEAIEEAGGTLEVLQVNLNDQAGAQSTISSALQADSSIDAVLALGPTGAAPALPPSSSSDAPATSSWRRSTSAPR